MGPARPTIKQPLDGTQVSLGDAAAALGRPLVLPYSDQATPSGVGAVWLYQPNFGPTRPARASVAVTFPKAGVWVDYRIGENANWDDVLLEYQAISRQESAFFQVMDLNGVPALGGEPSPDDQCSIGSLMFDAGGVTVIVFGHGDLTTKRAIAQSIVDRSAEPPDGQLGRVDGIQLVNYSPPARQIDLSAASATLGGRVVLPNMPLANASAAGPVWAEGSCPAPPGRLVIDFGRSQPCWVWVSFPLTGVSVGYLRPTFVVHRRPQKEKQLARVARNYGDNAKVIELGHVLALAIEPRDPYPGSVEFQLRGTRVIVAGGYDSATLRTVAQSIVDRSRS